MRQGRHPYLLAVMIVSIGVFGVCPGSGWCAPARYAVQEGGFPLPDGQVGTIYRYPFKSEGGLAPLTWSLAGGELPPGLSLDSTGKLSGIPTVAARDAYAFTIELSDSSEPPQKSMLRCLLRIRPEPLRIVTGASRLRIVTTRDSNDSMPSSKFDDVSQADPQLSSGGESSGSAASAAVRTAPKPKGNGNRARGNQSATRASGQDAAGAGDIAESSGQGASGAGGDNGPPPRCVPPSLPIDDRIMVRAVMDARTGEVHCVDSQERPFVCRQFGKGEQVAIIIENKNPYLFKYAYQSTSTPVTESAIASFESLLGVPSVSASDLGVVATTAAQPAAQPTTEAAPKALKENEKPKPVDPCATLNRSRLALEKDMTGADLDYKKLHTDVQNYSTQANSFKKRLDAAESRLKDPNQTGDELYCLSKEFIAAASEPPFNELALTKVSSKLDKMSLTASKMEAKLGELAAQDLTSSNKCLTASDMLHKKTFIDNLLAAVKKDKDSVTQIVSLLDDSAQNVKTVEALLSRPDAFSEVHVEGNFDATNIVDFSLTAQPLDASSGSAKTTTAQLGGDPGSTTVAAPAGSGSGAAMKSDLATATSPSSTYKGEFKFGGGPFFSISGGIVVSPLQKVQYGTIQDFQRNSDGSEVLGMDGKPVITTVVGVKEKSANRISPMIFLNGRLFNFDRKSSFLSGIHLTMGVTAKADNKGTDIDFLMGPSVSFLDNSLFITAGAYAGRDQRLAGGMYKGLALGAGVDPTVSKSYEWGAGFALSYRIPIGSKSSK